MRPGSWPRRSATSARWSSRWRTGSSRAGLPCWLGCHLYRCPERVRYKVLPHTSKSRFCPSCGELATDRWADGVLNDLLDVPCYHVVL